MMKKKKMIDPMLPESPAHGLVVHVRLVLVHPPQPGDCLAVHQLEHSFLTVTPLDELGATLRVLPRVRFRGSEKKNCEGKI